jgi:endonuclease/exonuclease/phosphatase family metal-dependent hydrolase
LLLYKPTQSPQPTDSFVDNSQIKIATFNLFNYLEPPNAFYDFECIYSAQQWVKKQLWLKEYLSEFKPDIIGFQEVFSSESLRLLVYEQGYNFFQVVEQPKITDEFIYSNPVVAIASRYPIVEVDNVSVDTELAVSMGLSIDFSYSRNVLRATIDIPHLGLTDCYVVHFKSKRSMIDADINNKMSAEALYTEKLKSEISGRWASSMQRGSEAALLLIHMFARREEKGFPMVLMGDFNNCLSDGVLRHLLTYDLSGLKNHNKGTFIDKYWLKDSWELYINSQQCNSTPLTHLKLKEQRVATHYYGGKGSVLDYILLSCEFDACYQGSLFGLSSYQVYDRHLINPIFERDGQSTDHGVVLITLELRI